MGLLVIATLRPVCVCVYVCDEFYIERRRWREAWKRKVERQRKDRRGEEWSEGDEGCGLECGFGFPSLRGEWKAIDSGAESKADRVAARGWTGTQWEHDLDTNKVTV